MLGVEAQCASCGFNSSVCRKKRDHFCTAPTLADAALPLVDAAPAPARAARALPDAAPTPADAASACKYSSIRLVPLWTVQNATDAMNGTPWKAQFPPHNRPKTHHSAGATRSWPKSSAQYANGMPAMDWGFHIRRSCRYEAEDE